MIVKEVVSVELLLENCEVIVVDAKNIISMRVKSPIEEVFIHRNVEVKFTMPEYFLIELSEEAKDSQITSTFDVQFEDKFNAFERLMDRSDLTNVYIKYTDGTEERYAMPWGRNEYINEYQSTYFNGDKLLLIVDGAYERSSFDYLHKKRKNYRER